MLKNEETSCLENFTKTIFSIKFFVFNLSIQEKYIQNK